MNEHGKKYRMLGQIGHKSNLSIMINFVFGQYFGRRAAYQTLCQPRVHFV